MVTCSEPIEADALRLRHEFLDLPGLRLSVPQTSRLLGISASHALQILTALARDGFLEELWDGSFTRRDLPEIRHRR